MQELLTTTKKEVSAVHEFIKRFIRLRLGWMSGAVALASSHAAAQTPGPGETDAVTEVMIPLLSQLGLGAVIGFCVGFMVKKVSKIAALVVGLAFVMLQVLAYYGVITIDWAPIKGWWDQATDPDTLQGQWASVRSILFANVPALGGAVPGFVMGLKAG